MKAIQGFWEKAGSHVGTALWVGAIGLLGLTLAAQAVRGGREGAELERKSAALRREIDGVRRDNQALRDELRALESDPVYVETLLRRWKMAARGERIIE
jgi:hypothetical protein